MRVERTTDGAFELIPDPGERITWVGYNTMGHDDETTYPRSDNHKTIRFRLRPYLWLGTSASNRDERNPRQWRLYCDGELIEGPKGCFDPNIRFPKWDDEPRADAGATGEGTG